MPMRFFAFLSIAFSLLCPIYCTRLRGLTTDPQAFANHCFDYIIVGGCTAGLVLANRLSEDGRITVGVIEAGELILDEDFINVPFYFGQSLGNPRWDWSLSTVPQPGLQNRSVFSSRGKIVGGSSALNFMVENRASKPEYDSWAALGNPGWDWDGLLPYFKKAEAVTPGDTGVIPGAEDAPGANTAFRGRDGPLKVSYNRIVNYVLDLAVPYVNSFVQFTNSSANSDPASGDATGIWQSPRTVDEVNGIRTYSANAYFVPVTKVDFDKSLLGYDEVRATGVQYSVNGKTFTVKANKEVILSAGSFQSPALLELSGIGQSDILNEYGIEDHLLLQADFLLKDPAPETWDLFRNNATFAQEQMELYASKHTGLLAATSAIFGFEPLQHLISQDEFDCLLSTLDWEIQNKSLTPLARRTYELIRRQLESESVAQVEFGMLPMGTITLENNKSYITVAGINSRPFSRGSVHINSSDPLAAPKIDPKYLDFFFRARSILEQGPFAELYDSPATPGPAIQSTEEFENYVRAVASTSFHPLGSTIMAPREIGGVVDPCLKVYGTSNLRVVDAGVMPIMLAAHIQSTLYAVAEKAADLIKGQYIYKVVRFAVFPVIVQAHSEPESLPNAQPDVGAFQLQTPKPSLENTPAYCSGYHRVLALHCSGREHLAVS
ncbi:hypothetical protein D9758_002937 [Tetrapyrgos nigripes]|uniref:Glucose-methanol-choline oxidoreductase N-terminal domain-containing protein n=1 Tax=Tetrapyrgos nigripes TaxID=182062 RepID=A0A8H5GPX9_9AGAR|nr:hypothetical protein D9758_002937 [Tetrapyrgos nigripes]